jgi:hypothetical protein
MRDIKHMLLDVIEARATRRAGRLASELVYAESEDRESIHAELEFQKWLAESCRDCRNPG